MSENASKMSDVAGTLVMLRQRNVELSEELQDLWKRLSMVLMDAETIGHPAVQKDEEDTEHCALALQIMEEVRMLSAHIMTVRTMINRLGV